MPTKKTYTEAVGRRKTSVARARLTPAAKTTYSVNDKELKDYFPTEELRTIATSVFTKVEAPDKFQVSIHVRGGGIHSQAEAVRHAIARSLLELGTEIRKPLKDAGLLTRDPRMKERRKFGLKKARKAPQWSKR